MRYRVQEKVLRSFACTPRRSLNKISVLAIWIKKKNTLFYRKVTEQRSGSLFKNKRKKEGGGISINNQFSIVSDRILKQREIFWRVFPFGHNLESIRGNRSSKLVTKADYPNSLLLKVNVYCMCIVYFLISYICERQIYRRQYIYFYFYILLLILSILQSFF